MGNVVRYAESFDFLQRARPCSSSSDGVVVELACSQFDHRFAPNIRRYLADLIPWDRCGENPNNERKEVMRIVERTLEMLVEEPDFDWILDEQKGMNVHSDRAIALMRLCHDELEWLSVAKRILYPVGEFLDLVRGVETAGYELFREEHEGHYPWANSAEQIALERRTSLATRVLATLVPPGYVTFK